MRLQSLHACVCVRACVPRNSTEPSPEQEKLLPAKLASHKIANAVRTEGFPLNVFLLLSTKQQYTKTPKHRDTPTTNIERHSHVPSRTYPKSLSKSADSSGTTNHATIPAAPTMAPSFAYAATSESLLGFAPGLFGSNFDGCFVGWPAGASVKVEVSI